MDGEILEIAKNSGVEVDEELIGRVNELNEISAKQVELLNELNAKYPAPTDMDWQIDPITHKVKLWFYY